jgi:plastin-1
LNFNDTPIVNVVEDMGDGIILLKLLDHLRPGVVDWTKVIVPPKSLYENIENVNYAISSAERMDVKVVNIGWLDIVNGDRKLVLGILLQLMKLSNLMHVGPNITGGGLL